MSVGASRRVDAPVDKSSSLLHNMNRVMKQRRYKRISYRVLFGDVSLGIHLSTLEKMNDIGSETLMVLLV